MDIDSSELHPEKHHASKFVTDDGIDIDSSELHPEKHPPPKYVTVDGMLTDLSGLQSAYLLLVDYQYYTL